MNLSRKHRKSQKQSKLYTIIAVVDVAVLASSFMIILKAM